MAQETYFEEGYKKLNKAQKEAVDTIEGPVMVVAGPGTGKTQILALRIANILQKTDTPASGILCLTFTNSGVRAMRARLESYIGARAREVKISTFHSFALGLIEKYYIYLDFPIMPTLLDDSEAILIADELLHENDWEYLRPRGNPTMYFRDIKNLISILKREGMNPTDFCVLVDAGIENLKNNPDSISTRGESKGKLKKEVEKKIESLLRTREVVSFYEKYEEVKKERSVMDYDDVLELLVKLVEESEDVRSELQEENLYVLVDEHQDSSGVQNKFLQAIWKDTEMPNIFVVGDDRQLIYGFSGASVSYFEEFAHMFGTAKCITLSENYRSTGKILALADDLLASSVAKSKLHSNRAGDITPVLSEYSYPRDEIIGAGLYFKKKIAEGAPPSECALLLPKNKHVRTASNILRDMGIPVLSEKNTALFACPEAQSILKVLRIMVSPFDDVLLANILLDDASGIPPMVAHGFLKSLGYAKCTLESLAKSAAGDGLFAESNPVASFGKQLLGYVESLSHERVSAIVATVGNDLLIDKAENHDALIRRVEIVRSMMHAAIAWEEKNPKGMLPEFLEYFSRLETYDNIIELATLGGTKGVAVMTLHKSKGLEYENVWIAHMNEEIVMSEKRNNFMLPESVKNMSEKRDELTAKRELYVAITRAKSECTISYAEKGYSGAEMTLASIVLDIPSAHFTRTTARENEDAIIADTPVHFSAKPVQAVATENMEQLKEFVRERYAETKISVTLLNNFFECPWKWYFRNFLRLPDVKSVSLSLGSAVHSTLEYVLKEKKLLEEEKIKEKIIEELQKNNIKDEKEIVRLANDGLKAVVNWINAYYKNLAKEYFTERSLSYRDPAFPTLTMYGKIDLTEKFSDGNIVVTDFKTGSSKTAGMIEKISEEGRMSDYMRQLAMYSYLIAGAERGTAVTNSRLLFLEAAKSDKNALYSTHIDVKKMDLLKKDIADYDAMLASGEWVSRPCNYNSYGKNTECEYCKLAGKIY